MAVMGSGNGEDRKKIKFVEMKILTIGRKSGLASIHIYCLFLFQMSGKGYEKIR